MNIYDFHKNPEALKHHKHRGEVVPQEVAEKVEYLLYHGKDVPHRYLLVMIKTKIDDLYFIAKDLDEMGKDIPKAVIEAIGTDPHYAYLVAKNLIEGPFPEGEDAIAKSAQLSYEYARDILKERFPKGEKVLLKKPKVLVYYIRAFQLYDWKEGEEAVKKDRDSYENYKLHKEHYLEKRGK